MGNALVSVRQAAQILGVSPVAVLDLVDAGTLSGLEINGQQFIAQTALDAVAAGGTE